jgi:hypothetical protein
MTVVTSEIPPKQQWIRDVWELVSLAEAGQNSIKVSRMQVPGGWIYKTMTTYDGVGYSEIRESTCFVPRPAEEPAGQ